MGVVDKRIIKSKLFMNNFLYNIIYFFKLFFNYFIFVLFFNKNFKEIGVGFVVD